MAVPLQSFLLKSEENSPRGSHCSEDTLPLFSIPIGRHLQKQAYNNHHKADGTTRNPFNDSLIASGADDGKVKYT